MVKWVTKVLVIIGVKGESKLVEHLAVVQVEEVHHRYAHLVH